MAIASTRSQHRHYKTLIVLVVAMTGGTLFLYWVGQLSPVTPLRSSTPSAEAWRQIGIRVQPTSEFAGFYHWRVDEHGDLYRSAAWRQGQQDPTLPGTIQILLTTAARTDRVGENQAKALARLVGDLRERYHIQEDRVLATTLR